MNLLKNKDLLFESIDLVNKCVNSNKNNSGEIAIDTLNLLGKVIKNSNEQTNKLMFYNDNNFFEKMKNSTYKKFINKLKDLKITIDEYKLPIIVIIGNESSGKSSLIRNMIKCDILPIDKSICTKCPIKIELINSEKEEYIISFKDKVIKLTDKEKILYHSQVIMNSIDGIVDDELHIQISNRYVINSVFYDLPGIREYPADLREKSKNIINKYINQTNTFIICAIPANTPRLTSNQALGMIIDAKKINDCIITLTKVDVLHEDDIELFIDRILMKSDEIKNLNIKKIVGVISYKNKDINENIWFNNNILNNIDDINIKKNIENSITVEKLLIGVDDMFNNFISTNWKKNAINKANQKILDLEKELNKLGSDKITITELYDFIKNTMNLSLLFSNVLSFNITAGDRTKYNDDVKKLPEIYDNYKALIIKSIINSIDSVFNIDNDYKIMRFTKLKDYLQNEYINIITKNYEHLDIWFNNYLNKFKYEFNKDELNKFQGFININFYRYILNDLLNFSINLNNKELLLEDTEWINKRESLNYSIKNYNKHKAFFENL